MEEPQQPEQILESLRTSLSEACPGCRWLLKTAKVIGISCAGVVTSRCDMVSNDGAPVTTELFVHFFHVNGRLWTHDQTRYWDFKQKQGGPAAALGALAFWTAGARVALDMPPWVVEALAKESE